MNKRRVWAGILASFIILLVALSVCTIITEAVHDCEGEGCRICEALSTLVRVLDGATAGAVCLYIAVAIHEIRRTRECHESSVVYGTPVTEKVRLQN